MREMSSVLTILAAAGSVMAVSVMAGTLTTGTTPPTDYFASGPTNANQRTGFAGSTATLNLHVFEGTSDMWLLGDGQNDGMRLWSEVADGLDYYVVSALNVTGESDDSAEATVRLLHVIPFLEDFEDRTLGDLNGQHGWVAVDAEVQANIAFGSKAGSITSETGYVQQDFAGGEADVWIDLTVQPVFSTGTIPTPPDGVTAHVKFDGDGHPVVFDGTSLKRLNNVTITAGEWIRVTIHNNYAGKTWDLYIDNEKVARDLGFYTTDTALLTRFKVYGGDVDGAAVDNIALGRFSPLPLSGMMIFVR